MERAAKDARYDFSGVGVPKNGNDLYSLRYSDFVVPLVKAVQELSQQNVQQQLINEQQQKQIDELKSRLEKLEKLEK